MRGFIRFAGRKVGEEELQAFIDGALGRRRRRQVERHLVCHPEDALRVNGYARQLELMRELRAQPAELPANPVLFELAQALGERLDRGRRLRRLVAVIALLGIVSAAGTAGVLLGSPQHGDEAVASVENTPAWLFPSRQMGDAAPVAAEAPDSLGWLGDRIGHRTLRRPDLEALGLRYVSSMVLRASVPPVVRLTYEDELGKRLFLHVAVPRGEEEVVFGAVPEGYVSLQWRRGPLVFALIAPSDSPQLIATMQVVSNAMLEEPVPDAPVAESEAPAGLAGKLSPAAVGAKGPPVMEANGEVTPSQIRATDPL